MEKEYGKIKKNDATDIMIRADDFGGKVGLTIREFTTSEKYTGFTKSGTRIPLEYFEEFKDIIIKIDKNDLEVMQNAIPQDTTNNKQSDNNQLTLENKESKKNNSNENVSNQEKNIENEIKEEVF